MKWEKEIIRCMDWAEVRYITYVPVMGKLVLRQINNGPWRIGRFGDNGHHLKPKSVKGAKAAAKRWMRRSLKSALKVVS